MLRYRRYRVFLFFSFIVIYLTYSYFSTGDIWQPPRLPRPDLERFGLGGGKINNVLKPDPVSDNGLGTSPLKTLAETKLTPADDDEHSPPGASNDQGGGSAKQISTHETGGESGTKGGATDATLKADASPKQKPSKPYDGASGQGKIVYAPLYELHARNQDVFEPQADDVNHTVHWTKIEHFPVAKTRAYPTATPIPIPRIQTTFPRETEEEKEDRLLKLASITEVARKSWDGYKKFAFGHDEVRPASGGYKDPFGGWSATLVDSLDTLLLLGFEEDFHQALEFVEKIDFTTSIKEDIALFEVTIRYLGGMLGAYDLSGGKHKILLDKSVELADVLMGAFETPNRMPITFYHWKPEDNAVPRRGGTEVVLAELGTLSLEFTRLAQLTKEPKYYDAIDRITDALVEWQTREVGGTFAPGLFPVQIDLSPCDFSGGIPPLAVALPQGHSSAKSQQRLQASADDNDAKDKLLQGKASEHGHSAGQSKALKQKRQAASEHAGFALVDTTSESHSSSGHDSSLGGTPSTSLDSPDTGSQVYYPPPPPEPTPSCKPQKLTSMVKWGRDRFTFNGMADSLYEYFPKTYLLLGGVEEKYQELYERSIVQATEKLLFRPMIPNMNDILFAGDWYGWKDDTTGRLTGFTDAQTSHLSCFIGGMYGMASKIFNRPGDMEYARKLTEGCVWAYNSTQTGIMAEGFQMYGCPSRTDCKWNETLYWEQLDPQRFDRAEMAEKQQQEYLAKKKAAAVSSAGSSTQPGGVNERPVAGSASNGESSRSSTDDRPTQKNPIKITDDHDTSPKQNNPQQISDTKLYRRQASHRKATSGAVVDGDDDAELPNDTSDTAHTPGEPAKYGGSKPSSSSTKSGDIVPKEGTGSVVSNADATKPDAHSLPDRAAIDAQLESISTDEPSLRGTPTSANLPGYRSELEEPEHVATHEEYVRARIADERLPGGYVRIHGRSYLLRPEAIESVWYMYRITGEKHWRSVGWDMWRAVSKYTKAAYGNSAIDDVTKDEPELLDAQESFWMAETVKYYFLLFSDEDVVNLDEWVLNTEAHPFKRPLAKPSPGSS